MSFLHPTFLLLLFVPIILALVALLAQRSRTRSWQQLVSREHEQQLLLKSGKWQRSCSAIFALAGLALCILALARPINGFKEQSALSQSRNLIIALDVSRSMETQDVTPSRLEEARAAAYELINALPADKIGLIVFSGDAELIVPLTHDHRALRETLARVNRNWASYGGTNFGVVVRKAMQDFSRSAPEGTNALVILSDGEDTVGSNEAIAEEARQKKLLIITVGVGTLAGGPVPDEKGENGLFQNAEGKHVISKLNAQSMQKFASISGGDYFSMQGSSDLTAFARKAAEKLQMHEQEASNTKAPHDLYAFFIWPALILLLLSVLLATEWRRARFIPLLFALCCALQPSAHAEESLYEQVHHKLKQEQYQEAAKQIEIATQENEFLLKDARLAYSQAQAYQAMGEAQKAKEAYSRALLSREPSLQADAAAQLTNLNMESSFEALRKLYEGDAESENPQPQQVKAADLEKIAADLRRDLVGYDDAQKFARAHAVSAQNQKKLADFLKKLDEEIERLKEQEQQEQQEQQDQQDQQDQQQDNQNEQEKSENQQNQDEQQQEQQQDNQNNQQNQEQQEQQNQDNQNEQQESENQQNQGEQEEQEQPDNQQPENQESQEEQAQEQQEATQEDENSAEEKERQRARSILQMHMDEEEGSPIPQRNYNRRPPEKDY